MKRHFYLNNPKSNNSSFNRKRGFRSSEKSGEKEEETKTINLSHIQSLRRNYNRFHEKRNLRYSRREIELPLYIDLIKIRFYTIFNLDLKTKFNSRYGLFPVEYSDFNKTVLFEIDNQERFGTFLEHLEHIFETEEAVQYSGQDFNLIALIQEFDFYDNRLKSLSNEALYLSFIESAQVGTRELRQYLIEFLEENQVSYTRTDKTEMIFIRSIEREMMHAIDRNFDIVKAITSAKIPRVRPGMYGEQRFDYGFEVSVPENLPVVGVIDSGISPIGPLKDLLVGTINLTNETDKDPLGHGTMVAGLLAFGSEFPSTIQESYTAKSKLLAIKVVHTGNEAVDFPAILEAIIQAHIEYGVRIFNMSLAFDFAKAYNDSYSDFAFELDKLSYQLDILIFISVGNFDDKALTELVKVDKHPAHEYPEFFYSLDSESKFHSCHNTNISPPSDSLNNISVGALAGNLDETDYLGLTPSPIIQHIILGSFILTMSRG